MQQPLPFHAVAENMMFYETFGFRVDGLPNVL